MTRPTRYPTTLPKRPAHNRTTAHTKRLAKPETIPKMEIDLSRPRRSPYRRRRKRRKEKKRITHRPSSTQSPEESTRPQHTPPPRITRLPFRPSSPTATAHTDTRQRPPLLLLAGRAKRAEVARRTGGAGVGLRVRVGGRRRVALYGDVSGGGGEGRSRMDSNAARYVHQTCA